MTKKQPVVKAKHQSQSYWERRANERMDAALRDSQKTLDILSKAYMRAVEDIEEDIFRIYRTFTRAFDLDPQKARELLDAPCSRDEYLKILSIIDQITDERVRSDLLAQASSGAYKARLSRLEALRQSVGAQAMRLADIESGLATDTLAHTITETFNRTMYDIQRGTGLGFAFAAPDTRAVNEILNNPWSGEHFSSRIWGNAQALADEMNEKLTADFLTGKSARRAAQEIAADFGVRFREAERLVRTETCYMATSAQIKSYIECGLTHYVFTATLDRITSEKCQKLDGKVFAVKEAAAGINLPPMHPNCRSLTVGKFDEEIEANMTRMAEDPLTGEAVQVPGDMSYEEWKRLNEQHYGKARLDAAYKAARNEKADKEQWERYKKLLGRGNVPVTLEKFQEIKYTDIASWDEQKALYREVSWQKRAREKTVKGSAHSVPRSGEPDSVYDHSVGGRVRQRRYFGSTGKPMLDIDLTDHGNPKAHKPRHAHDFIEREDGSLARTDPGGRELTRAERIANEDILKGR